MFDAKWSERVRESKAQEAIMLMHEVTTFAVQFEIFIAPDIKIEYIDHTTIVLMD